VDRTVRRQNTSLPIPRPGISCRTSIERNLELHQHPEAIGTGKESCLEVAATDAFLK
jgi:hypothetical protein